MLALYEMISIKAMIGIISIVGVYVLTGLTGMFSLGQAAFMAIGSYVSGICVVKLGLPFPIAIIIAIIVAVLIGFIVGLPTMRLRRDYISLITLGFGEALTALLNKLTKYTGGASGFYGIPKLVGFWVVLGSTIVAIALVYWFKKSKYGRQCIAVKSDELAAKAMGINVTKIKMTAFLFSIALTAYSGAMYAFYITYVDPSLFAWKRSADWVIMVFFGGANSLTGSVFAGFFLTALPEFLRSFSAYRYIVYAILVLIIINFKPNGLFGNFELFDLFKKRKKKKSVVVKEEVK